MITFQRRKLPVWVGSTSDYKDYSSTPELLFFENEVECFEWIKQQKIYSNDLPYSLKIADEIDDIPDGKNRRAVILGGLIGWIEDVIDK